MLNVVDEIIDLHSFLYTRKHPVSMDILVKEMMVSKSTVYHLLKTLREKFGCEIICKKGSYKLTKKAEFPDAYYGV